MVLEKMDLNFLKSMAEPINKLIDTIRRGIGVVYEPRAIVKKAEAESKALAIESQAVDEALKKYGEAAILTLVKRDDNPEKFKYVFQDGSSILDRAKGRLTFQEVKSQENIEGIINQSVKYLPESVSEDEVDSDWVFKFFNHAKEVSEEKMQEVWGKILAQEVSEPGSYNLRTLEVLKSLTKQEAELFQHVCKFTTKRGSIILDMIFSGYQEGHNIINLTYEQFLTLGDAGLIILEPQLNLIFPPEELLEKSGSGEKVKYFYEPFHGGRLEIYTQSEKKLSFPSLVLTPAGKQLMRLIEPNPDTEYFQKLNDHYEIEGIEFVFIPEND